MKISSPLFLFKKCAWGWAIGTLIFLSGCATSGIFIEESNYSVKQHRIAITQAFGLVREVSRNGRVITSGYHDGKFKELDVTEKTKARYFSRASVLGSIRPYRVSVEVILEKRDPETGKFIRVEDDETLAAKRAAVIQQMLNQSRDELSTFDEENPF